MTRQMKYYLIACGAWNLVRAFLHSFEHGYDIVFELRMIQCLIPLGFAALVVVAEDALKVIRVNMVRPSEPTHYYQSVEMAPDATKMPGQFIYIKDHARVYRSDGMVWIPV